MRQRTLQAVKTREVCQSISTQMNGEVCMNVSFYLQIKPTLEDELNEQAPGTGG